MFRRSSGIGVIAVAVFGCLYLIATVGIALAGQKLERQRILAFTGAFLAHSSRDAATRIAATNEANVVQTENPKAMSMPLVIPLFLTGTKFDSTLVLVNGGGAVTYADVAVRDSEGNQIVGQRVNFAPHSQQKLDIGAMLVTAGSPVTDGSIVITPSPQVTSETIAAQLSMTYFGSSEPNYIDEETAMPMPDSSPVLRGVADPGDGSPIVAVTSLVASTQYVTIECIGGGQGISSKQVALAPNTTFIGAACTEGDSDPRNLDAPPSYSQPYHRPATGITLISDGAPGSFAAFALAPHRTKDGQFFSSVPFDDPKMLMSPETIFAGVPVGSAEALPGSNYIPEVSVANFSAKTERVTIQYALTPADTPSAQTLQTLILRAGTSKSISFPKLQGDATIQNSFVVSSNGLPGDVLAKVVSKSDDGIREVELIGKDQMDTDNGGNHPWSIENGRDATLILFNPTNSAQYFNILLTGGAVTWQKAYHLQSMQTKSIGIRDLVQDQDKDDNGNALPKDIVQGQVVWYVPARNAGRGRLLETNKATLMARNFSCGGQVEICEAFIGALNGIPVASEEYGSISTQVCMSQCSGSPLGSGGSGYSYSWSSQNTGIASISGSSTVNPVLVAGVYPGTTTLDGEVSDGYCTFYPQGPAPVVPSVAFIGGNSYIFAGTDSTVTVFNNEQVKGNPTGGTYSWSSSGTNSGISFSPNNTTSADVSKLTSTTYSSSSGDTTLKVGYTYNNIAATTPASKAITVLKFEYLGGPTETTINYNGPTQYGYSTNAVYTVYTIPGKQALPTGYDGMSVAETVQGCSGCITGPGATNGNSQVVDNLGVISSQPLPSNYNVVATQTLSVGGYLVRNNTLTFTSSAVTITNNGPTQ